MTAGKEDPIKARQRAEGAVQPIKRRRRQDVDRRDQDRFDTDRPQPRRKDIGLVGRARHDKPGAPHDGLPVGWLKAAAPRASSSSASAAPRRGPSAGTPAVSAAITWLPSGAATAARST